MTDQGAIPRLTPAGFIRGLWRILRGRARVPPSLQDNRLLEILLKRRSVRSFSSQPVPDDVFQAILEAGRLAPSTVNLQTWSFFAFDSASWQGYFGRPLPFHAARAVLVCADSHRAGAVLEMFEPYPAFAITTAVMNAALAAMNMNAAAEALGVSSVMLSETGRTGLLDIDFLRDKLALPDGVIPLPTIIFGYARSAAPPMPPRLPLEAICFDGPYRETDPAVLQAWLEQMQAGYQASHLGSSFGAQIKIYLSKIGAAEAALRREVLRPGAQQ